jgi:hypothetical protein
MANGVGYKAVAFHRDSASLQVCFLDESRGISIPFSVQLPKDGDGKFPVGEALDALIRSHAPMELFNVDDVSQLPSFGQAKASRAYLFDAGVDFVSAEQKTLFRKRALVQINGLPIPLEVR